MHIVKIGISGNTAAPCLQIIQSKGFVVSMSTHLLSDDVWSAVHDYSAEKDGLIFNATNLEELLGLIAMWEHRGDSWHAKHDEVDVYHKLQDDSPLYDKDGKVIEHGE